DAAGRARGTRPEQQASRRQGERPRHPTRPTRIGGRGHPGRRRRSAPARRLEDAVTRRRLNNSVAVALCSAAALEFAAACGNASKPAAKKGQEARKQEKIQSELDRLDTTEEPGAIERV